jgi:hypothetical protein
LSQTIDHIIAKFDWHIEEKSIQNYLRQLLADITYATENVSWPFAEKQLELQDWMTDEEENNTAQTRELEEWTGIKQEMLPPGEMLSDEQVNSLPAALIKMQDAYNCCFVLQTKVPERIQYAAIRENFNQTVKVKQWHMGFFAHYRPVQRINNAH